MKGLSPETMNPELVETLTGWRRHLHANPAPTLDEGPTATYVAARLRELGVTEIAEGIGAERGRRNIARTRATSSRGENGLTR